MFDSVEILVPLPSWIEDDNSANEADSGTRQSMIRVLQSTSDNLIVETASILIPPDDIINCSPLYSYTLYRLLLDKGIKIASSEE